MTLLEFILLALASFRLTHLIVFDQITESLRKPFHQVVEETTSDGTEISYIEVKGHGLRRMIGQLLACHWCTGIWSALILVGFYHLFPAFMFIVVVIFAVAGAAALIELIVQKLEHG